MSSKQGLKGEQSSLQGNPSIYDDAKNGKDTVNSPVQMRAISGENSDLSGNNEADTFPRKRNFTVSFEELTVHVPHSGWKGCIGLNSPVKNFGQEYLGMSVDERSAFYTLDRVSGFVHAGEMCLILGPSGSGKSTLLRALCGRLNATDELHGTLMINGIPLGQSEQRWRRMSTYVSANDASHSPVLTVSETLLFAAQCTSDGSGNEEQNKSRAQKMMEALGIAHVSDTVVGDENLRGVSGGQKRRVTVGEMAINNMAPFLCLDNITDGLASTDSLSLIKNISSFCKREGVCSVISILQPSDEIVGIFDKLMVLSSSGEMSYFGPVDRSLLRDIFLGLEGNPDDDSGAVCDLVMNQSLHEFTSANETAESVAVKRFYESALRDDLVRDLARIRASAPRLRDRDRLLGELLPKEKYGTSRLYQFKIIGARRFKLIARNSMTYARIVIGIMFGVIVGSLFSSLNRDVLGALGRTGYMFLNSFLVLMLSAAVTLPEGFRQRVTLFKHRASEYYSGRVAYVAQVFLDIPLSVLEATLMASISYYWVGMNPGVNHFFFFLGILIGLECVGQSFGRLLCAMARTQVYANALSSLTILLCGALAGFMPAYNQIPWVFRWLSWLNPVSYAFEAMMINEFDGQTMYGIVIPNEASLGEIKGVDWLASQSLPRIQWGNNSQIKCFDLGMLFVWALVYDTIGAYFSEHTRDWYHNQIRRPQAKVRAENLQPNEEDVVGGRIEVQVEKGPGKGHEWPQALSIRELCYSVRTGNKTLTIQSILENCKCRGVNGEVEEHTTKEIVLLNGVTARFRAGRMSALMGQSGAGKTTLMDVIAGYKTGGSIQGQVMIDGIPKKDSLWKKISGYAEQNDILNPYMSVLETLRFTAACRLPGSVDREDVISQVIELMGLDRYTNMMVGREKEGEGLPKHARKRLTIANQLVVRPKVLFLDEPTSGLGCNAASLVIGAVRRCTDALGLITLATIHQPSRKMFETFDDLLLLAKGGRVAYMGELGPRCQILTDYFCSLSGTEPPQSCNPADYVLHVIENMSADSVVSAFQSSSQCSSLVSRIQADSDEARIPMGAELGSSTTSNRKFFTEFVRLWRRHLTCAWRNPSYSLMRIFVSVGASLFLGILFFDVKPTLQGAIFSIAAIFFTVFVLVIPMQAAVVPLIEDRAVLYREVVSGTYSRVTYGLGQLFADIPFHMINTVLMFVCMYYLIGFRVGPEFIGYFILMLFLANWVVMSMGQLFALISPNEETANGLAGLSVILSVLLMGFLITVTAMPSGWLWGYWANLFRYMLQGLVTNEISGQSYHIDLSQLLPDLSASPSFDNVRWLSEPTKAIAFEPGVIPSGNNVPAQAANFMSLTLEVGEGINTRESESGLKLFIECMVNNECLVEPLPANFISCNILNFSRGPPCREEFNGLTSGLDLSTITSCFDSHLEQPPGLSQSNNVATGVPASFSAEIFDGLPLSDQRHLVLCLMRATLPAGTGRAVQTVKGFFDQVYGVVMFIVDIIQNGINIPGDAILFYFGWAKFEEDRFQAPFKWHYCMTAVVVILFGIEMLKLFSVRFIVWTKR